MANDKKDRCWKTPGMGVNPQDPNGAGIPKEAIDIHEDVRSFDMGMPSSAEQDDSKEEPYGQPIEAGLAIRLMRSFWDRWRDMMDKITKQLEQPGESFNKEDFLKFLGFVEELISVPDGITFDKSIVLKILSQPGCEGLRCYTALKDDKTNLALVLVGVSKNGFDLHYKKGTLNEEKAEGEETYQTVANKSLIGEYGHPPGFTKRNNRVKDEHYVLLRLSEQLPPENNK